LPERRTIVCFGDSNTWGYVPGSEVERYPHEVRWPGRLAAALGDGFEVIPEGLNGRTATIERPDSEGRNGLPYLLPCLHTHAPVDLVVIFLGTNDVNFIDDERVAWCVARLVVRVVRTSQAGPGFSSPQVLVVCPPPFDGHRLGPSFAEMCAAIECELLDLDGITTYTDFDVEHLDEAGHAAVAAAVEERVRRLLA
jgi:lysophospholipase L1-like esterase